MNIKYAMAAMLVVLLVACSNKEETASPPITEDQQLSAETSVAETKPAPEQLPTDTEENQEQPTEQDQSPDEDQPMDQGQPMDDDHQPMDQPEDQDQPDDETAPPSNDSVPAAPQTEEPMGMNDSGDSSGTQVLSMTAALDLANKSGCLACHSVDKKIVGPAWQDVSAKYKGDAGIKQQLINKVKNGGKGNWTEVTGGIPMPPYSPRVSDDSIDKLVTFVLSLPGNKG